MATKIEWADETWNPAHGCEKVSPGCANCYAEHIVNTRWKSDFSRLTFHPARLKLLEFRWKRTPKRIFVGSMTDLFQQDMPDEYLGQIFDAMEAARHHQFLVLSKRARRLADWWARRQPGPHIWAGVSVESTDYLWRVDAIRDVPADVRWISAEPLLEDLTPDLDLTGISWVVVGGESGSKAVARSMDETWVRAIYDQCRRDSVSFFFKQWGRWAPVGRDLAWEERRSHPRELAQPVVDAPKVLVEQLSLV